MNVEDRILTESECILNGLIILCRCGYHTVRASNGYFISGGPIMREDHLAMETLKWFYCPIKCRWEFPVFPADPPSESRNVGPRGEPV